MQKKTVLITGASSGIGRELARVFASQGWSLVLTARNETSLAKLKAELETRHQVQAQLLVQDLAKPDAASLIHAELARSKTKIDILVNNAGFGDYGLFAETDWAKQEDMVQVNILALMHLTRLFLPDMLQAGTGRILNIASVAGFSPGPYMSVYYARKAFDISFSQALASELQGTGITVTASCPGPTTSGFQKMAGRGTEKLFAALKNATAREVAEFSYKKLMRGRAVAIYGLGNKLLVFMQRFAPRSLVRKVIMHLQGAAGSRT